jgi:hypothetical protein
MTLACSLLCEQYANNQWPLATFPPRDVGWLLRRTTTRHDSVIPNSRSSIQHGEDHNVFGEDRVFANEIDRHFEKVPVNHVFELSPELAFCFNTSQRAWCSFAQMGKRRNNFANKLLRKCICKH